MRIVYTRHARNRMRFYEVSEDDVQLLLNQGERQPGRGVSYKAEGTIQGATKTIVFNEEGDGVVIITVWSDIRDRRGA